MMTFPNIPDKHSGKPVISPEDAVVYRMERQRKSISLFPSDLILCYSRYLMKYIENTFDPVRCSGYYGSTFFFLETNARPFIVAGGFGIGAPVTVSLVEDLIPLGVRNVVSVGFAGTLQADIPAGDIILCDRAIRDEGTSHHYLKPGKYASASTFLTEKIRRVLDRRQLPYRTGTTWTTDAPYRETEDEVIRYQKEGVLTVDMEASALFAAGEHRNIDVAALFTVSDSLAALKWKPDFDAESSTNGLVAILETAIETLTVC